MVFCDNFRSTAETATFYEHLYDQGEKYIGYSNPDVMRREEFNYQLEQITRFQPNGGRLLDVGCSTGEFLEMASQTGKYIIDGIDISSAAARVASARLRINIFAGTVDNIPAAPESYDVVTAWEVIEHMAEPAKFLRTIWRLLKPGGLLCLSTPNTNKIRNRIPGKQRDIFFIPPEHLFYFNGRNLRILATKSGFLPLTIDVSSRRFLGWIPSRNKLLRGLFHVGLMLAAQAGIEGFNVSAYLRKGLNGA